MIGDALNVSWKEWRELLAHGGSRAASAAVGLAAIVVLGVVLPLVFGRDWVASAFTAWTWLPVWVAISLVADSFAGERERRTLETLLASRLPDRAIVLGKFGAAVGLSWAFSLATLLLGLATVNFAHRRGGDPIVPSTDGWISAGLSLLGSAFVAGIGVLVSMRSATVREATQRTMRVFIASVLGVGALFIGVLAVAVNLPAVWADALGDAWAGLDGTTRVVLNVGSLALGGMLVVAVTVAPLALAMRQFRRGWPLLDQ